MSIRVNDVPLAASGYDYTDKKIMVHDLTAIPNASTVLVDILDLAGLWNSISVGDKGDISVTNSGSTWTIDNNVVSFAKIQQLPAFSLIGNPTNATANTQAVTLHSSLSFSGTTLRVASDSTVQKIIVSKAGSVIGTRQQINFIEGTNVTLTLTDDNTNNKIDVQVDIPTGLVGLTNGDKGDIVVSGTNSVTWLIDALAVTTAKIADNNVTYAKFQQSAANRLIGNPTGATANVSEIPLHTTLAFASGSLKVIDNTSIQKHQIWDNGSLVSTRRGINFNFTGFTYTIVDNSGQDRTDVNLQANPSLISVYKNGSFVASNAGINFIEGPNVTITAVNSIVNSRIDVTIESDGGGSGGPGPLPVYATLNITNLSEIDLTTVQGANYINLTSTNATETIETITNFGSTYPTVRFIPEPGLTVTFVSTADNANPVTDEIEIPTPFFDADGDYNDWFEVEQTGDYSKQSDGMTYGPLSALPNVKWDTVGNPGINEATQFIGTTDGNGLVFRTNNLQRAKLTAGGNFLIGSNTDSGEKLQVTGTTLITGNTTLTTLAGSGTRPVYANPSGTFVPSTTVFQQYSVPVADATGQLVGNTGEVAFQADVFAIGTARAPGTITGLALNGGRTYIEGSIAGLKLNIGSGLSGGGVYDTSKIYNFMNRGNSYLQIASLSQTSHLMTMFCKLKINLTEIGNAVWEVNSDVMNTVGDSADNMRSLRFTMFNEFAPPGTGSEETELFIGGHVSGHRIPLKANSVYNGTIYISQVKVGDIANVWTKYAHYEVAWTTDSGGAATNLNTAFSGFGDDIFTIVEDAGEIKIFIDDRETSNLLRTTATVTLNRTTA